MMPFVAPTLGRGGATGGSPTSTQWRLLFPTGTSTTNAAVTNDVDVYECQMRATSGGANLCSGGTASASSEYSGSYLASKAFNGNSSDQWASTVAGAVGSWLQYTFPSAVTVNEFTLTCTSVYAPTAVRLQYYDGSAWQTYIAADGPLTWGSPETKTFTYSAPFVENVGYTKWRLYFATGCTGTYMDISECEMRASIGGVDRCFGGVVSATNTLGSPRTADKAFDNLFGFGDYSWVPGSPTNGTGTWLEYDFFRPETIHEVQLTYGGDANSSPQSVNVQYYDPGTSSWVTYWSMSPSAWTANGQTFTASGP
jgi:hypothetical protein